MTFQRRKCPELRRGSSIFFQPKDVSLPEDPKRKLERNLDLVGGLEHGIINRDIGIINILANNGELLVTGWWFGTMEFYVFPYILGIASSQLTNSYFSEG